MSNWDLASYFELTKEIEDSLWSEAIFIFDTSAIGSIYFMSKETCEHMIGILGHFLSENRVWIPAQVAYEYTKNREKFINNPIKERYSGIKCATKLDENIKELSDFVEKVKSQEYHPFFDPDSVSSMEEQCNNMKEGIKQIKATIRQQIEKRKEEILKAKTEDTLFNFFKTIPAGLPFDTETLNHLYEEGEKRYKNGFPPGYKDAPNKDGHQKYGDFIIWKEILAYSKQSNVPVIFICNDTKIDWYEEKDKCVHGPRHELIKEFIDNNKGKHIWFYTLEQFVFQLTERYKDTDILVFSKGLAAVRDHFMRKQIEHNAKRTTHTDDCITIKCECGNEFDIDPQDIEWSWDCVGSEERNMGTESEYISESIHECPYCHKEIELICQVYEYPEGCFNTDNITSLDNVEIIKSISLSPYINISDFYDSEYEECERCGEMAILNSNRLCDSCQSEYDRFVNSDD